MIATTAISLGTKSADSNDPDFKDDPQEATRQSLLAFHGPSKVGELSKASFLSSL